MSEGPLWREQRRFMMRTLRDFGAGKSSLEKIINKEKNALIRNFENYLEKNQGKPQQSDNQLKDSIAFNPAPLINSAVANVIGAIVFGDQIGETQKFLRVKKLIEEIISIFANVPQFVYVLG